MPRAVWKGAITFGLVNIPVNLYPATTESQLDLDLLDKRDFAPVGYRRVNKKTGEEVPAADLVKGYEYEDGQYVVVSDEDFKQANVKATQTVDIQSFVEAAQIPPLYFDRPYYLEPGKRGEKGYALLRETLRQTGKVGVATVVIRTRQHLAIVLPLERLLVLNLLRFAEEIRPTTGLSLPEKNRKTIGVSPKELEMAERLVEDMTEAWNPKRYRDTYTDDLMARIKRKAKAGETEEVTQPAADERPSAQVIDLMSALKRSLGKRGGTAPAEEGAATRRAPRRVRGAATKTAGKPSTRRSPAVKSARPKRSDTEPRRKHA